ncbi:hypothetical protein P9112_013153 [Eukaryota sp. TZLM1-RC]
MIESFTQDLFNEKSPNEAALEARRLSILRDQLFFQIIYYIYIHSQCTSLPIQKTRILIVGHGYLGRHFSTRLKQLGLDSFSVLQSSTSQSDLDVTFTTAETKHDVDIVIFTTPTSIISMLLSDLSFTSHPLTLVVSATHTSKKICNITKPYPSLKVFSVVPQNTSSFHLLNSIPSFIDLDHLYKAFEDHFQKNSIKIIDRTEFGNLFIFGSTGLNDNNEFQEVNKSFIESLLQPIYDQIFNSK